MPSSGLQLGPAPTLGGNRGAEQLQHPCNSVSLAISLLSGSTSYSLVSHSTVAAAAGNISTPPSSSMGTAGRDTRNNSTVVDSAPSSVHYSLDEQLPEPQDPALLSPAPPPAAPGPAPSARMLGWSAVASNPVVKRLTLASTAPASCRAGMPAQSCSMAPPASPPRAAVMRHAGNPACPGAPKRPRPALLLVPLAELGRIEVLA